MGCSTSGASGCSSPPRCSSTWRAGRSSTGRPSSTLCARNTSRAPVSTSSTPSRPVDDTLLELPNVVGAPHSLGYTDELIRGCVEGMRGAARGRRGAGAAAPRQPYVLENPLFTAKLARLAPANQEAR